MFGIFRFFFIVVSKHLIIRWCSQRIYLYAYQVRLALFATRAKRIAIIKRLQRGS